ncbi:MAG: hypothetical protein ABH886_10105 [Candidatus Desantisbacteria bacterium]
MPRKVRELIADLQNAGFVNKRRQGKSQVQGKKAMMRNTIKRKLYSARA